MVLAKYAPPPIRAAWRGQTRSSLTAVSADVPLNSYRNVCRSQQNWWFTAKTLYEFAQRNAVNVAFEFDEDLNCGFGVNSLQLRVQHLRQRFACNQKLDGPRSVVPVNPMLSRSATQ